MSNEKQIISIQYLRGLAALGVVLCHYGSVLFTHPNLAKILFFGKEGVTVFFMISGFVVVYSLTKYNYKVKQFFTFILKRSIRIDPVYIAIIVAILIFNKLLSYTGYPDPIIKFHAGQFFANIFYLVPFTKYDFYAHIFWTLHIEFQLYVLIGLLYFLSDKKIYKPAFLLCFCALSFIKWPNGDYIVFAYASIFALGISFFNFYIDRKWQNLLLPIIFSCACYYQWSWPIGLLLDACCLFILYFKAQIKLLRFLGNISYSLYLTHILTAMIFELLVIKLLGKPVLWVNQIWWLSLKIFAAIAVATGVYYLIEKPSLRLSKKILYKKSDEVIPVAS